MARRTVENQDILANIRKLKDQSNAKEVELLELIGSVYENLKDKQEKAVEKIEDTATIVNEEVHSRPWRYIGGAALCGFLAGFLLRR